MALPFLVKTILDFFLNYFISFPEYFHHTIMKSHAATEIKQVFHSRFIDPGIHIKKLHS